MKKQIEWARKVIDEAWEEHEPVAAYCLFSGGHDSLCATHVGASILGDRLTAVAHINTGIGIEQTRQFVRDTCERYGWPLREMYPDDKTYDELVLDMGFPRGPASHNTVYYYLKQRQVRRLVRESKTHRMDRVMLVTGIRVQESDRRMGKGISVPLRREGAQLWVNPILKWSKNDCNEYIDSQGIPRNEVVDLLHRSGECLCGAFAQASEIKEIELWFPGAADRIHELEARCREKGLVDCKWAAQPRAPGKTWDELEQQDMFMCQDCELRGGNSDSA